MDRIESHPEAVGHCQKCGKLGELGPEGCKCERYVSCYCGCS